MPLATDIFRLMVEEEERRRLVRRYEILGFKENPVVPCRGVVAKLDAPLRDVIPVLFLRNFGKAAYVPGENILTLRHGGRLITFYPDGRVALNRAWSPEAARAVLEEVLDMVNEAYREFLSEGPPSEEEIRRALELSWRELLKLLPGTNCGRCGRPTCYSLAIDVLRGEARLSDCRPLMEDVVAVRRAREVLGPRLARALGL